MSNLDRVLGHPLVATLGRWSTRRNLRVVAMHAVEDLDRLDAQLALIRRSFRPVGASEVIDWYRTGRSWDGPAVWVTFDDGDPTTVIDAAPVLERHGVRATAFVCPAFIEGESEPWWDLVVRSLAAGRSITIGGRTTTEPSVVTELKRIPDEDRRAALATLPASDARTVTVDDLTRWRSLGGELGNHTWDHPCLDQCEAAVQVEQIDRAGEWLDHHGLWDHRIFAYPNGDRTDVAERHLTGNGYELVALFDHSLTSRRAGPHRVSRLRLDAGASPERTSAVTSGWHTGLFGLRGRVGR